MRQKIRALLITFCSTFLSAQIGAVSLTENTESSLITKGDDCRGCRGHQGKRGLKGPKGATGISGISGCPGPQGPQGARGPTGSSSPATACQCTSGSTSFTFSTQQNLALSGQWQAFIILPDTSILSGPIVNIQDPSTTFVIPIPPIGIYSYLLGTYAVILKNISITGLNTSLLNTTTSNGLVVSSSCFTFSPPLISPPSYIYNFFDIPFNPGEAVIFYFGDPGCHLTA